MIKAQMQFEGKREYDGTLAGIGTAIVSLLNDARDAGAPDRFKWMTLHDRFHLDAEQRSVSITVCWEVESND